MSPCSPARNFKLLDELEEAQKGKTGSAEISLGLVRDDDTYMHEWQATIFQSAVRLRGCFLVPCSAGDATMSLAADRARFRFHALIISPLLDAV